MRADSTHGYDFRPLTGDDLELLRGWLRAPHVARWWGDADQAVASIAGHIGSPTVAPYFVVRDGTPIGYIQSYDIHAEDDHPYRDQPAGSVGIDQFIGEPGLVGKGIGPELIDVFVDGLFAAGAPRVVVDPDPDNAIAIRAYEKAGFRAVGSRTPIYGPAVLMVRDNNSTSLS